MYGDFDRSRFSHDEKYLSERDNLVDEDAQYRVRGWLGLVRESGHLQDDSGNLNKVAILARGKVALEDLLESLRINGLYAKYVIGEIEADFLDLTSLEDIATSSRQDFIQGDERFTALRDFLRRELAALGESRVRMKADEGERRAVEIPAVREWYESLKGDGKAEAKRLFGRINQIATDETHRKTLYKHGVLAFEHLRHKEKLSQLGDLDVDNLEATIKLFSELDDIEASWYYQITRRPAGHDPQVEGFDGRRCARKGDSSSTSTRTCGFWIRLGIEPPKRRAWRRRCEPTSSESPRNSAKRSGTVVSTSGTKSFWQARDRGVEAGIRANV